MEQILGSDEEEMRSRVYFDVVIGDKVWPGQQVIIRQSAGSSFEGDKGALEVVGDALYDGPHNYQAFRDCVEAYYRSLIGASGSGILIEGGANIVMTNNRYVQRAECSFDAG